MFSDNRIRYFLVVASIALATYIIWKDNPDTDKPDTSSLRESTKNIDSFVTNAEFITFDKNGKIRSVIRTENSKHYPVSDVATLTKPEIIFYQQDRQPWQLEAKSGEYSLRDEVLKLKEGVSIVQQKTKSGDSPWTLTTESLFVDYKSRFISTDQQVKISDGTTILTGLGMQSYIDNREIKLLSNVRGSYVPK